MKRLGLLVIISALGLGAQAAAANSLLGSGWTPYQTGRPKLAWENLKGYRLYFHPDDPEPDRRSLNLALPMARPLRASWAIVRPLTPDPLDADAWLRVEGVPDDALGRVALTWNGVYRGRPFPDAPYRFEVHLVFDDGEAKQWDVLVLKSLQKPRLIKIGGRDVSAHKLVFRHGDYEPDGLSAIIPRGEGSAAMIAQVRLPELPEPFNSAGIMVQGRRIADAEGQPVEAAWDCLCQQPIPADSPARQGVKKVRCDWDLSSAMPGDWDLRLAVYHQQASSRVNDACDEPVLDEDRLRVRLLP